MVGVTRRTATGPVGAGRGGEKPGDVVREHTRRRWTLRWSPSTSPLIFTSILAPLVGGPVGSVVAIVFGWAARHEPLEVTSPRRRLLALAGMCLGLVFTFIWAVVMAYVAISLERGSRASRDDAAIDSDQSANVATVPAHPSLPEAGSDDAPRTISKVTTVRREGSLTVVDIGSSVPSLLTELAKERAEGSRMGDVTVVMTTRPECESCRRFSESLGDPRMQVALSRVRLVRIDVEVFDEELPNLKIPNDKLPGFFLLAPDLYPRDGIDAGEWVSDVASNMAPVLGAFVRGKYTTRKRSWQPVSENRIRL